MSTDTIRLFCIPYSGGNAYSYSEFKKYLPLNIELCNLELPGRGKRISEPLLSGIQEMTEDLFRQIKNRIDGPYAVFGHSLGALLSYTLCRYISGKGLKLPATLFVSGQTAASLIKSDDTHLLSDDRFINVLREMNGTPEELLADDSFARYFLPVIRADFQSIAGYRYEPHNLPLSIPISVFIGNQEKISDVDVALWQQETTFPITVKRFEGGHFFIFNHTKEICRLVALEINKAI